MSGIGLMLLGSSGGIGQQDFTTAGTFTWVVPNGITSCSVVCVGGGGGGSSLGDLCGGGGALAYVNNISLTPGESMTVVVGAYGAGGSGNSSPASQGTSGGASIFKRSSTVLVQANGGSGARSGSTNGGTVAVGTGGAGGTGVYGGGGAGGYSGAGGNGALYGASGASGSGGGGGGGGNNDSFTQTLNTTYIPPNSGPYGSTTQYISTFPEGAGGGGVGILGSGSNGAGGVKNVSNATGGGGGSSGTSGGPSGNGYGGFYGGGGGGRYVQQYDYFDSGGSAVGADFLAAYGFDGNTGAVRIIFPASGAITREFPSTNTGNL
jgi:hypothetical protein